jgi:tRNA threonylcarbamoyladenosine biosynthesis protein TsaB
VLILGLDTTTQSCSVALLQGETLLAEYTLNIRKTHSQRLMPLVKGMLRDGEVEREELQAVAVAAGPGSFTGIRIGVATARGLAQGLGIPAIGVSTLEALAEAVPTPGALICPLLDARRDQVYTALYRREREGDLEALIPPAAMGISQLLARLEEHGEPVHLLGDGLGRYGSYLAEALAHRAVILSPPLRLNRAGLVALRGRRLLQELPSPPGYLELLPVYLRRPEAERRLEIKEEGQLGRLYRADDGGGPGRGSGH